MTSIRGGIGATLGVIGSQLPYPYVHVIYWIVQIMLVALAVQTGVVLAVNIHFQQTGTASQTIVRLVERSSLLLCIEDNHFIADSGCFLCLGDNGYTPSDDNTNWPASPNVRRFAVAVFSHYIILHTVRLFPVVAI